MPSIKVVTTQGEFTVENDTIANVTDLFAVVAETLGIDAGQAITVNGAAAGLDTPLADGDRVQTAKAAGAKGN
jgi:molybdopterin converting factor small subunit